MTTTPEFIDQATEHWDFEATRYRTIGDEHDAWHILNGWQNGCPLDCEAAYEPEPPVIAEAVWTQDGDERSLPIFEGDDLAAEARRIATTHGVTVTIRR